MEPFGSEERNWTGEEKEFVSYIILILNLNHCPFCLSYFTFCLN